VALTAGLALLTFVKAFGLAFLARARSAGTEAAVESGATMRIAMLAAVAMVVALGLVPGAVVSVSATAANLTGVEAVGLVGIDLTAVGALLDPAALALMGAAMSVPIVLVSVVASRRRARRRVDLAWGCGGMRVSPRMQYTATSYAEPLARVFDDALRPERDVDVTHLSESRYLVERVQFRQQVSDVVEDRAYQPLVSVADRVGVFARQIQNGSIHRYLGYAFAALLIVLLVVSL
jgi:hydrogenase-4 component B